MRSAVPAVTEKKMSTMTDDLWQAGCERLAAVLPEQQFNTWIRPLPPAQVTSDGPDGVVLCLRAPNRFKLDWIRSQYAGRIEEALAEVAGRPVRLDLVLAPRDATPRELTQRALGAVGARAAGSARPGVPASGPMSLANALVGVGPGPGPGPGVSEAPEPGLEADGSADPAPRERPTAAPSSTRHKLNPALTFDTLVAGRANQMARTAALHVAGAPGQAYNPLFIYGGVGLGKTHLIHAVGNALLADRDNARVLYLHAEQFISDVVKNYQRKTFDELKAKYHSLDL
ncbi:MAG: hypothetical protein RJA10_3383, partial [Pseudomonadota bacterium]